MMTWFFKPAPRMDQPDLRSNLIANTVDGAFYALTLALVSQQAVMPIFVMRMGGSNVHIGLLLVVWTIGVNFPGIFVANRIQQYPRKKPIFLRTALVQRLAWAGLGLFALLVIDRIRSDVSLLLFFVFYAAAAVAGSINLPVWFDLIAKITPKELRGRLFATRNVLGGILGAFGGLIVVWALNAVRFPLNFGVLFMLAFAASMISYAALVRLQEEAGDIPQRQTDTMAYFAGLPGIFRRNRDFRHFLVSDALLMAATMASAFYAVNAIGKFRLSDAAAGTFTAVMMCTSILGNLLFGYVADHRGHKLNLVLSGIATAAAALIAVVARSPAVYLLVFVGSALQVALSGISRLTIVAELSSERDRPTYIALTNMVTAPFALFGIVCGWIANNAGFDAVFVVAALLAIASALWLGLKMTDPRKRIATPAIVHEEMEVEA